MSASLSAPARVSLRGLVARIAVVLGAVIASSTLSVPASEAMTPTVRTKILHVAASKAGTPYRYGADGPRAFDCSGYTKWVYAKAGRTLPRTTGQQRAATRFVKKSDRRRGDLVFFKSGGRVYHVGIYAGRGRVWHSPRTGERVHRERIWTSSVSYGRKR